MAATISISCCQNWFDDLEKHWNITPRKSLTLQPPNNLNPEHSLAYVKGFFDGDGCAHLRKNGILTLCFYGTFESLDWIKSICDRVSPQYTDDWREKSRKTSELVQAGKIYNYSISGYRAEQLAEEILKLELPGMLRKWDKIKEWLKDKADKKIAISKPVQLHVFDESKVYLGRLCKRGHDYSGTGQSLRRVGHGSCVKCGQINAKVKTPMVPMSFYFQETTKLAPELDGTPRYLGCLCVKHPYQNTGYSLRYRGGRGCIECLNSRARTKREEAASTIAPVICLAD
ncbi:hypothetical protein H6F86_20670 [Phormidium sp. FACHB-592]|uniref:Homing endonuclease n=1 Tax=Stenomitos frigidus AS-A4 TaxID=2933935 RepID=A0ABV0KEI2_9CYAN|nr:hypothetical protein [Phormidium sp. FACHB-592]MBD2076247.1 hypothetical protein [Phormidium sp. FACHB-592]